MLHYHSINKFTSVSSAQLGEERVGFDQLSTDIDQLEAMQCKEDLFMLLIYRLLIQFLSWLKHISNARLL